MMDFCSPFLSDIAYFGGYPNKENFNELIGCGFEYFIDLTTLRERQRLEFDYSMIIPKYKNLYYINFSIIDNNIPTNQKSFLELVNYLKNIIEQKKKIYLHCKGGHGRSSLLVASLLCYIYLCTPHKAFHLTKMFHERRHNLKEKYRGILCPQLYSQRKFIIETFKSNTHYEKNTI